MTYKTFFFNYLKTSIQSKTLLSRNLFPKTLIRKRYKPDIALASLGAVCMLDTDGFFSLKGLLQNCAGSYVPLKNKTFSHKKLKNLKLKSFFFSENFLTKTQTLSLFYSSLKLLHVLKKPQLTTIICPAKGGYKVFSQGLVGLLPKSHYKFYFLKKIKFFRLKLKNHTQLKVFNITSSKNNRYLLTFFSVVKILCIIKRASLFTLLKRQNAPITRKLKKHFKYQLAKNCFSFKFVFLSSFVLSLSSKENDVVSSKKLKYLKSFKIGSNNFNSLVALNKQDFNEIKKKSS